MVTGSENVCFRCKSGHGARSIGGHYMMDTVLFTDHDILVFAIVAASSRLCLPFWLSRRELNDTSGDWNLKSAEQCGL
jgi:hypothetical protein